MSANNVPDSGSISIGTVAIDHSVPGSTDLVRTPATTTVSATPTVTASSAYAANNEVGGLMTFAALLDPSLFNGIVQSIRLRFKDAQTATFKLYLFKTNPTNSTWTDKTAPAINVADIPFAFGPFTLSTSDSGLGTCTLYELDAIAAAIQASSATLYGILVTTGTPTFGSTSDVSVEVTVLRG